jgi:hydroxymethylbilane synthase
MRLRLLSRSSDLAVLQANIVADALRNRWPSLQVELLTRSSLGDRDTRVDLWQSPDKGLFTADLSQALVAGDADAVVHSWKDLPIQPTEGTVVAATLPRADARDVLLVRPETLAAARPTLHVLTSSRRRAYQLEQSIAALLPWTVERVETVPVRGNIPTRLEKLLDGQGDALVMAKAALDRLLSAPTPDAVRARMRASIDAVRWMVLPLREFPTAPAQGALAIEVAADRADVRELVEAVSDAPTRRAVDAERRILAGYGGGCHEAIGATVLVRDYGVVTSVRGCPPAGDPIARWSLEPSSPLPPAAPLAAVWPRPDERDNAVRRPLDVRVEGGGHGWWVARADAIPEGTTSDERQVIWAAGTRTWQKLARRGFWVNGCSDGLGDTEATGIETLAGRPVSWQRLTHADTGNPDAVATYSVDTPLPGDLAARTHFFWTSGSLFRTAIAAHPDIRHGWHACGPGRTSKAVREMIDGTRVSVWLDYDQWLQHVNR